MDDLKPEHPKYLLFEIQTMIEIVRWFTKMTRAIRFTKFLKKETINLE